MSLSFQACASCASQVAFRHNVGRTSLGATIMSNSQTLLHVPSLIEQVGTGEDTHGLIGKTVRVVYDPMEGTPEVLRQLFNAPPDLTGETGTVFHISEEGEVWADFGDNPLVQPTGPEQVRVVGLGLVGGSDGDPQIFEVVE
ncbi:hypothetical protein bb8_p09 [Bordetella phage vB_BbrP_BB8]|uniref:Uncharacterized protein n=1 Tax=Bordetella phage vB_BbrP_BB8 TaxID=2587820 RepID=A0A4Y5TNN7_9CAUD|nr:hypothetical protein bb8_p09 [Bordetella phage vB_BbrP_BB8]